MSGIQHPDDKNTEDISLNRPTKGGETGVASNSPITGFQAGDFEKLERKTPPTFSQSCSEKGGETGEGGVPAGKNSSPLTPASPPSPPFFRAF